MTESGTIGDWASVPVKLLDIRLATLRRGESFAPYRMPAHGFLLAAQGEARLLIGGLQAAHLSNQLLHGCKGDTLQIQCLSDFFEYYLILYKPLLKAEDVRAAKRRAAGTAPFASSYDYGCPEPWQLRQLAEQLHRTWTEGGELERVLATGLFYQFAYEQFRQLRLAEEAHQPDLAEAIAGYLRVHYRELASMDELVRAFHYSGHYLSRVFRRKYGTSPMGYLARTRMNRAKELLAETSMSIRDIAESVGYADMYYFNKQFKKQLGMTPVQFKMQVLGTTGSIRPKVAPGSFIAPPANAAYSVDDNDNCYHQSSMWSVNELKVSNKPSMAASLLFGISLLLAACGGNGAGNGEAANGSQTAASQTATTQESTVQTRVYKDALDRETEIPVNPEHVVVITYGGYLLPLGLKPAGADDATLKQYPEKMAGVPNIGEGLGKEEAIVALDPDLIIVPDFYEASDYENYAKIAPTVAVAWGGDPDVVNTLRTVGDIMNRKTEAEAWISGFEKKLQRIRDQLDVKIEPGTTALSFIYYDKEMLIGGEGGTLGKLIYQDYGFQLPEALKQYADGGTALSQEAFVANPADYYFTSMSDEEMVELTALFKEPLYSALPAVKNNRMINVSREKWNYGPYRVDEAIDDLIAQMNKLQ
ncbi:helix-turn-helix domain-containing protein [Cohnella sp. GCM10012308]|uniref:helix-turn-helix domain-containing protein n=1 Tax=Cohnella sp. GCM10012308 TaxID=3317329 RepID=UPI00361A7C44